MHILAGIAGLAFGFVVWFSASHLIAVSMAWVEDRRPHLAGSKPLRATEAVVCGALFVGCLALAFWIMRLLWNHIK
jgi:hypothetical protein